MGSTEGTLFGVPISLVTQFRALQIERRSKMDGENLGNPENEPHIPVPGSAPGPKAQIRNIIPFSSNGFTVQVTEEVTQAAGHIQTLTKVGKFRINIIPNERTVEFESERGIHGLKGSSSFYLYKNCSVVEGQCDYRRSIWIQPEPAYPIRYNFKFLELSQDYETALIVLKEMRDYLNESNDPTPEIPDFASSDSGNSATSADASPDPNPIAQEQ